MNQGHRAIPWSGRRPSAAFLIDVRLSGAKYRALRALGSLQVLWAVYKARRGSSRPSSRVRSPSHVVTNSSREVIACATWTEHSALGKREYDTLAPNTGCLKRCRAFAFASNAAVGSLLLEVESVLLQRIERNHCERFLVRRSQDHGRCNTRLEGFAPSGSANAPPITGLKARETDLGHGRD